MQNNKPIFEIPISELKEGLNFILNNAFIVYVNNDEITATRNKCRHQGGKFSTPPKGSKSCVLTCPLHGWSLDTSCMTYSNPTGNIEQPLLKTTVSNGILSAFEEHNTPWEKSPMTDREAKPGQFTVRFLAHACAEITMGDKKLITDPWLEGPAFTRGWWLVHRPPEDWLTSVCNADAVYISHNHSDHLNPTSIKKLAKHKADIPIYVPDFGSGSCESLLQQYGMKNVHTTPFDTWIQLDEHARFMILNDATGREDSGLIAEFANKRLLNTVDCCNLNNGDLPEVDMLLTAFASGASGFPVCWHDLYGTDGVKDIVKRNRTALMKTVLATVANTKPKIYMPFAGYFTEAHPADADIKKLNVKNNPDDVCRQISDRHPNIKTVSPRPGTTVDIVSESITQPESMGIADYTLEEFNTHINNLELEKSSGLSKDLERLQSYYDWSRFQGDIILHVIVYDEYFENIVHEHHIDFNDPKVHPGPPSDDLLNSNRYLRMKVRQEVYEHVMCTGEPWEEISIGFQARFFRNPDVYNFDFWDHFQNHLPTEINWLAETGPSN